MGDLRRRLYGASFALLAILGAGTFGYYYLGDGRWALGDCFYMTVITLSTVGYGEVLDGMDKVEYARLFTTFLLVFGMSAFIYFASTLTAMIIEGDLKEALRKRRMREKIKKMSGHVVVCGAGSTGKRVIEELMVAHVPVVAVDQSQELLQDVADHHPGLHYIVGDATDDEVLEAANLANARGLVAALASDKDNLFLVVSARQANSRARIVARGSDLQVLEKLKKAGADGVVSPNFIGGMRMVSELVRPEVVRFLDVMLKDARNIRIDEVLLPEGTRYHGVKLRDADLRRKSEVSVLAVQVGNGDYVYNPDADFELRQGMTLVVLGELEKVVRLREQAAA